MQIMHSIYLKPSVLCSMDCCYIKLNKRGKTMKYLKALLLVSLLAGASACTTTQGGQQAGYGQPQYEYQYNDDGFYGYTDRY